MSQPRTGRASILATSSSNHQVFNGKKDIHNLGAGDSYYIAPKNFIKSGSENNRIFAQLVEQVDFQQMFNFGNQKVEPIPRLIAAQTEVGQKQKPIYRMPGCNQSNIPTHPWTPVVQEVRDRASDAIGGQTLNHCVITLFRNQDDSLGFHKDKLLDLEEKTHILSISFGSPRPIVFIEEGGKNKQTVILQPGSILAIGPKTNRQFQHGIPKVVEELQPRVSLSFRSITSFIEDQKITGQGEEYQTTNYPFIKSYDNVSEYTDEIKELIAEHHAKSQAEFQELRTQILSHQESPR